MLSQSPKVLIVGAGPSGLVLALTLLKNGIPVRIVERDPEFYTGVFRGSGIGPRTQEVEHFLGVLDDIKKLAAGPPVLNVYDQNDPYKVVQSINLIQNFEVTPPFPITQVAILGQAKHQAILRKHVEALGGKVELATTFTGLKQDDDGVTVTLTKTQGDTKTEETARFAYVIGTDGGRSAVRKSLGIEFLGESKDFAMFVCDVRMEGFDGKGLHKWGEKNKNVVQLYSHEEPGMYQILLGGDWFDLQAVKADTSLERLQQEFASCIKRPEMKITKVYSRGEWRRNIRMAKQLISGRVFLAGDAAHIHSPAGGQGLNTSVMDSFNLAWKLALVLKGISPPSLLKTYETERLPVISEMLNITTNLLNALSTSEREQSEAFKRAKEAGILAKNAKEGETWVRGWKLTQLDLNYRHSPILVDEMFEAEVDKEGGEEKKGGAYGTEGHEIRAGDRAPEATALQVLTGPTHTTRMFDILVPTHHTVLIFPTAEESETQTLIDSLQGPLSKLSAELVRTYLVLPKAHPALSHVYAGVDFVVKDNDLHAFRNYGIKEGSTAIVIVRPDAYVGAIVKGAEGIQKYFSAIINDVV